MNNHLDVGFSAPIDDGVSLDTFVGRLIGDDHPGRPADDYDEWLARVTTAIDALPEKPPRYSPLDLR